MVVAYHYHTIESDATLSQRVAIGDCLAIDTAARKPIRFGMRPARARWAGFLLTMVWMVARLALPLQPTCPHHAPHLSATTETAASGAAVDGAATHHAHHGASAVSSQGTTPDSAPASTAPECECAAHCCAAPGVQFIASAPIASVVLLDAPDASTPESRRLRPALRLDVAQPPATAPPALTL